MSSRIETAMVLAAGLGKRMRPLTDKIPKPMVPLAGRPLVDHALDRICEAGVGRAVVNVHYRAEVLEAHIAARNASKRGPEVSVSDERGLLLETGGGVLKALPLLGEGPFLICNSDTTWLERGTRNIDRLIKEWDDERMDSLLLLAEKDKTLGYEGVGDFHLGKDGRLRRRAGSETAAHVFSGVSIAHPRMFADAPEGAFSLNILWDRAIAKGRLYGLVLDGWWLHVGTPAALAAAEEFISEHELPEG
jgi:N-acetyl-alpha-D-muramate 1-phosphate uridylyltransferase